MKLPIWIVRCQFDTELNHKKLALHIGKCISADITKG